MKLILKYSIVYLLSHSINAQTIPIKPEMVFVEGGGFSVDWQEPKNFVLSDFYIGKYEVTVSQFRVFCEETGREMPKEPLWGWVNDFPMVSVSYDDALAYCKWLGEKYGGFWRLPTEREWVYAAKGGKNSNGYKFAGSDNLNDIAWWGENSNNQPHPIGQKKPNELGIYDMNGNVGEWASDWHSTHNSENFEFYGLLELLKIEDREINPMGYPVGAIRVRRGAGWDIPFDNHFELSSYGRGLSVVPNERGSYRANSYGFRVVRNVDGDTISRVYKYKSYLEANTWREGSRPCDTRDLRFLDSYISGVGTTVRNPYLFIGDDDQYLLIGLTDLNKYDELLEIIALMSCVTPQDEEDGRKNEVIAEYWNKNQELFLVARKQDGFYLYPQHILAMIVDNNFQKLIVDLLRINYEGIKVMDLSKAVQYPRGDTRPYSILDYAEIRKVEYENEKRNSNGNSDYYDTKIISYDKYIKAFEKANVIRLR